MIITTCPACAAPLAHDAPRCIRCHTRYCNKTCQHDLGGESSAEEKREALQTLEEVAGVMRRVLGPAHPETLHAQEELGIYRQKLSVEGV